MTKPWKIWPPIGHWAGGARSMSVNGQPGIWLEDDHDFLCVFVHHGKGGQPTYEDLSRIELAASAPVLADRLSQIDVLLRKTEQWLTAPTSPGNKKRGVEALRRAIALLEGGEDA